MDRKPVIDAEFEIVADPHPSEAELAERDYRLRAELAAVDREYPDLKGWRLWGAISVSIIILTILVGLGAQLIEHFVRPLGDAFAGLFRT